MRRVFVNIYKHTRNTLRLIVANTIIACSFALIFLCVQPANAQTVAGHPANCWWCARESFNLNDPARVWAYLTADITVIDKDATQKTVPLKEPNGEKIESGQFKGFIYGQSVSVHVLETNGEWSRIEAYDIVNDLVTGWVRTSILKTSSPSLEYGLVVDKQTQTLHVYKDGAELSTLKVSTGLPNKTQPYNETASGEFMVISWTGGFWSGNMYCDMGLRFNGGDLLHLVPALVNKNTGVHDFGPFEPLLGNRASHGCIRVQREKTAEGVNMKWLWDNLKIRTKLIVWDDSDRPMFYPEPGTKVYYNPDGGKYFHADAYCPGVKARFLPLTAINYSELETEDFNALTECTVCEPPAHPVSIDAINAKRGFTRQEAIVWQIQQNGGGEFNPLLDDVESDESASSNGEIVLEDSFVIGE